jgi:hypothetical protein
LVIRVNRVRFLDLLPSCDGAGSDHMPGRKEARCRGPN